MVSSRRSKVKQSPRHEVSVKQQPFTAMLSPGLTCFAVPGAAICSSVPSSCARTATIVPTSSIKPVNIILPQDQLNSYTVTSNFTIRRFSVAKLISHCTYLRRTRHLTTLARMVWMTRHLQLLT